MGWYIMNGRGKRLGSVAAAIGVVLAPMPVLAANFDGSADSTWADGSNWSTDPEYPGGATATDNAVTIAGGLTCDLATALSQNLTSIRVDQSTLNINSGGSVKSISGATINEANGNGDAIVTINTGGSWTNPSQLRFARHGNSSDKTGVSELHVNGGFYGHGHNIDLRDSGTGTTARLRLSSGTMSIGGGRNWGNLAGTGTQNKEVLITGGTYSSGGADLYVAAQNSALLQVSGGDVTVLTLEVNTNGPNNRIEVTGTNATFTITTANVFGGTLDFTATADGVSSFATTTLDLEGDSASDRGALEVDLTSYDLDASGDVVELFSYTTFNGGAFSSTNITGVSSYELDYTYAGGTKVVLKNLRLPPDGTLFWQQ